MGRKDDKNAVVDSNANVIGVNGLRVVDASAFPFLPPGHPMATVCEFQITDRHRCLGREDRRSDLALVISKSPSSQR
jgi:hypothetical protein